MTEPIPKRKVLVLVNPFSGTKKAASIWENQVRPMFQRSHVEAVWFRLAERQHQAGNANADPLQRAASHLAFRMHCPLRLTVVAKEVAFTSPGNLSRLFRLRYGLSFQGYLQKLRMEKAAELLSTTRLPIASVARRVGYRDVSRFGQHFKRRFRSTPRQWRSESAGRGQR